MVKKASTKKPPRASMTATDHRKKSEEHYAKARLHSARADLLDAKNPTKGKTHVAKPY